MNSIPTIRTKRLVLRPFTFADAKDVRRLAGDRAIADTTKNIPHPYEDGMAEEWIATHQSECRNGKGLVFAIQHAKEGYLIGAIGLVLNNADNRAELGYWIGVSYWNQGYATEVAAAVLDFGFASLGLNRIHANYLKRNPASGRVMQKIGMQYEGCLRQHFRKWGKFEDLEMYGILAEDWKHKRMDI